MAALGYAACALAGALWSTGFLFGKIALGAMNSTHMVLYRFLFASLALLPVLRRPQFTRPEWAQLLAASLLGVPVQFLTQFYGLSLTTVSHAALMVGTMPGILALGATIFAGERLPLPGWLALAGSSAGIVLIVLSGGHAAGGHGTGAGPTLEGDLLVVVSLLLSLGWLLWNKALVRRHSALQVTAWGLLAGTAMLVVWVLGRDVLGGRPLPPVRGVSAAAWWSLVASGVLCTAATSVLWNWGMRHVPASRAAVFLNIEPALGSALGIWLLGDHLGAMAWVGGGLILVAAVVLTRLEPGDVSLVLE
ncbi:DMT family transporter [Acidipila sp. EB88]|nr:DMT family transporter [Acidipila sp. EB88]